MLPKYLLVWLLPLKTQKWWLRPGCHVPPCNALVDACQVRELSLMWRRACWWVSPSGPNSPITWVVNMGYQLVPWRWLSGEARAAQVEPVLEIMLPFLALSTSPPGQATEKPVWLRKWDSGA